ncbi:hypothetical protein NLG97_g2374 [Lecanicillium saksenae]|uniref:Uncharacterized protein n=1 Tax=Lecanicillium saksenae TaxID=468837 RepID=A0ACC1R4D6_9HYPO|nr:hypothetical protein NLG97_g2374 [Lecanicillium saksenae]
MKFAAIIAGGILSVALAASPRHVLHEQRSSLHADWAKGEAAHDAIIVPARIALKQSNIEKGQELIAEISDPDSPKYGQYLSPKTIADMFAPQNETINSVKKWLIESGIPEGSIKVSTNKGWMHFNTTTGELGSLLRTQYHHFTHKATSRTYIGTESYSLPQEVSPHIDFVMPATSFTQGRKSKSGTRTRRRRAEDGPFVPNPNTLDTCDRVMTPKCIRALYGIPEATSAMPGNDLTLFETDGDMFRLDDLNMFYKDMQLKIPQGFGPGLVNVDGGTAQSQPGCAGPESSLDVDIVIPLIYPQNTTVYQVGDHRKDGTNFNQVFDSLTNALNGSLCKDNGDNGGGNDCNKNKLPNVLSVSWSDVEDPTLASFHKRQCTEWMKLGLAGTTVIFSSGDDGTQVTDHCFGEGQEMFTPDGVSTCPYVTSVGGTHLPRGSRIGDPEAAADGYASGGGFSNIFPIPDWQAKSISTYLKDHPPPYPSYSTVDGKLPPGNQVGRFNRNGRGFPDISANGKNSYTITNLQPVPGGGTSMSAPLFASMINLINEDRLKANKSVVGYINPSLYKMAENGNVFNDITDGGMGDADNCGTSGFNATTGWDPVTGLGTPNYKPMHEFFMNLHCALITGLALESFYPDIDASPYPAPLTFGSRFRDDILEAAPNFEERNRSLGAYQPIMAGIQLDATFSNLPTEILDQIQRELHPLDLRALSQTSNSMHDVLSKFMWNHLAVRSLEPRDTPLHYLPVPPAKLVKQASQLEFRSPKKRSFVMRAGEYENIDEAGFRVVDAAEWDLDDDLESKAIGSCGPRQKCQMTSGAFISLQIKPQDCLIDLSAFQRLTSLCWIGPKAVDLPSLYTVIEANAHQLRNLHLDFICMFHMHNLVKEAHHETTATSVMEVFTLWMKRLPKSAENEKPLSALKSLTLANIPLSDEAGKILQHCDLTSLVLRQCDRWQRFCRGARTASNRHFRTCASSKSNRAKYPTTLHTKDLFANFSIALGAWKISFCGCLTTGTLIRRYGQAFRKARYAGSVDAFMSDEWLADIKIHPHSNPLAAVDQLYDKRDEVDDGNDFSLVPNWDNEGKEEGEPAEVAAEADSSEEPHANPFISCECLRDPLTEGFREFADWAFGPHGLLSLEFVVYGDFSPKGQNTRQNVILYRDKENSGDRYGILQCPHRIWRCQELRKYTTMVEACSSN